MQHETDSMEAPCPCQKCGEWFDLGDGIGSRKWFPNTVICESCGKEEESEIEMDEEIEDLKTQISEANYTLKECTQRLKNLGVTAPVTQNIDYAMSIVYWSNARNMTQEEFTNWLTK